MLALGVVVLFVALGSWQLSRYFERADRGGPHLGYMGQWFIFAVLGLGFYSVLLRRYSRAATEVESAPLDFIDVLA